MRAVQIALMGNMAKMTISSLNRTRMGEVDKNPRQRNSKSCEKKPLNPTPKN
jgi:hypothetical protein